MSGENLRKHKKNRRYIFSAQNRLHLRYKNQTGRCSCFLFLFSFFSRPRLFPLSVARLLLLFSRSIIHLLHRQHPPLPLHALSSLSQPSVSQPLNRSLHLPRPEPQLAKTKKKKTEPTIPPKPTPTGQTSLFSIIFLTRSSPLCPDLSSFPLPPQNIDSSSIYPDSLHHQPWQRHPSNTSRTIALLLSTVTDPQPLDLLPEKERTTKQKRRKQI